MGPLFKVPSERLEKPRIEPTLSIYYWFCPQVVFIIEKKHSRACTGTVRPLQDKNPNKALFAPSDYRLPRLIIPMEDGLKGMFPFPVRLA